MGIGFRISTFRWIGERAQWLCRYSKWPRSRGAKRLGVLVVLLGICGCRPRLEDSIAPDVVIPVVMRKWAIEPARITVRRGQVVELDVTTPDVEHGLSVFGMGVREPVQPGRVTRVKFRAEKAGEFAMSCNILCGRGHDAMTGVLVVTE